MHDIHFPTTKDLFYIQKKVVVVAAWHSSVDAILSKEENDCEGKGASSKPLKKIDDDDASEGVTSGNGADQRGKDQNTTRGRQHYYVLLVVFYTSLRV